MTTVDTTDTTGTTPVVGTVEQIAPETIVLDTNVRTDARLDKAFVASIREHGVMQPVVGYRADDGTIHVLQGQRRTLAAVEAKRETIPVYLASSPDEAQRIIGQIIENDQRAAFTDAERAEGYEQLSLLGMSAAQIAKRAHAPRKVVEQSLAARQSEAGRASLSNGLTIEQAAVMADLGTDEDTIARLNDAAERGMFDHTAERIRQDRERAEAIQVATDDLTARAVPILDETPWDYYYDGRGAAAPLTALDLDESEHATCPGHAAVVEQSWNAGKVTYLCTDWKANGHENARAVAGASGTMTKDEKEDRRAVIENNKQWRAAAEVRADWLHTFAQRKSAPKDAASFILASLATASRAVEDGMSDRKGTTQKVVGADWRSTAEVSGPKALVRAVSIILAGHEQSYADVHTWRNVTATDARFLRTITSWGYTPSDVERATVLGEDTED